MSKPAKIFLFLVLLTGFFGVGKSNGKTVLFAYQRGADTICRKKIILGNFD